MVGRVYNSTKDCKFDTEYLRRCTEEAFPSTVGSNSCKLHWHRYRTTWGKMSNKWTLLEKSMDTQVEFSVCSRVSEDYDHLVTYFDTLLQPNGMSIGEVETLTRCYRSLNRVRCIPTMGIVWDSDYPRLTRMAYYAGEVEHWDVEPIRGRKGSDPVRNYLDAIVDTNHLIADRVKVHHNVLVDFSVENDQLPFELT